jgi:hypothetical protein
MDCHGPMSLNGPRTATLEEHTHHKAGSAGSSCIACHIPKIETTVADVRARAHIFAFITPAMTDKYKIPNPAQIRAFEALARTFTVAYGLAANLFARQLLISTFTGEVGDRTRPSRLLGRVGADYPD